MEKKTVKKRGKKTTESNRISPSQSPYQVTRTNEIQVPWVHDQILVVSRVIECISARTEKTTFSRIWLTFSKA
jgi:hypothetical protein